MLTSKITVVVVYRLFLAQITNFDSWIITNGRNFSAVFDYFEELKSCLFKSLNLYTILHSIFSIVTMGLVSFCKHFV